MNDWDLMFKSAKIEENTYEEPMEEDFEMPQGYKGAPLLDDGYGYYGMDENGSIVLLAVRIYDERKSYEIQKGCTCISAEAFEGKGCLEKILIPESVRIIEEGALSNSGGWADEEKGICEIELSKDNKNFVMGNLGLYQKLEDGGFKLLLYIEEKENDDIVIEDEIKQIGRKAFYGRKINSVKFADTGYKYRFPSHAFFMEELLKEFGKNDRLYDFAAYDAFLLRNHFNSERLNMICDRLNQPYDLTDEKRNELIMHVRDSLKDVLRALSNENAIETLKYMIQSGIFTEENITEAIDILNHTEQRELLTYLMDYKHENFKNEEFDFSI